MSAGSQSTQSNPQGTTLVTSWWNRRSTATGLAIALFASSIGVAVVGNSSATYAVPPAEVSQLANVTEDNSPSDPGEMTQLGNKIIFRAYDDDHGTELWISNSDGTDPKILKDINPDAGSNPYGFTVVGNYAYFSADNGVNGQELWKTNGTSDGTTLIHDIYPGVDGSSPNTFKPSGSLVFFFATDAGGNAVWVTSGTAQSTRKVGGIEVATQASNPYNFVQLNGLTYFRANDGVHGDELWVSDGTPQGSRMIKDVNPGGNQGVDNVYALGGRIFFRGNDGVRGWELWTTDGTEVGTKMLKNINPSGDAGIEYFTYAAGKWYFRSNDASCCDQLRNGQTGYEVYVTDGTTAGTRLTKDITTNLPTNNCWWCYGPTNFKSLTNGIIFQQDDGVHGNVWYRSDGTTTGTTSLDPDINDNISSNNEPVVIDNQAYFLAGDAAHGLEPWVTDGSPTGTRILADINTNNQSSGINYMTRVGNTSQYVFSSNDGIHGEELWVTDFTDAGTHMVRELQTGTENSGQSSPSGFVSAGNKVFFRAFSDATGWELWVTDGTSVGTRALDLNPGRPDSTWDQPYGLNGKIAFRRQTEATGYEPWISDGTIAGTRMIREFNPSGNSDLESAAESNGKIYLKINDQSSPGYTAVWVTDGTSANTIKLTSRCPNDGNPDPQSFTPVAGGLLFKLNDCQYNHKWWRTDGTVSGTARLDLTYDPLTTQWNDVNPIAVGDKYYYTMTTPESGTEIWITDGSPSGTHILKDINTVQSGSSSGIGVKLGNKWIFNANDGIHGDELWVSDGTDAGTHMVRDLQTGTENSKQSSPSQFVLAGNKVFFRAFSDATGWDMWVTDGTSAGTRALDLNPGRPDASWDQAYALNGRFLFRFSTPEFSYEPWISDGTVAGTHMIKDINPSGQTEVNYAIESAGKIYMTLNDYQGYSAIWVSDGTAANTFKLTSRCSNNGDPAPSQLTPVAGGLLMRLNDCIYGHKWWRTDGTVAGTARLDLTYDPLTTQWNDINPIAIGDKYYYTMATPESGTEIWITDGSPSGTHVLKEINTAQSNSGSGTGVKLGNKWIFNANDGIHGDELWVSDGTDAGTYMVRELQTGTEYGKQSSPSGFVLAGNKVFFRAFSDATGWDMWVTDGTSAGTRALDLNPGRPDSSWDQMYGLNGKIVFRQNTEATGYEPWISDGTVAGTHMIKDFGTSGTSSSLETVIESNGKIYLRINDGSSPSYPAVWVTDGTSVNTTQLTTRCANNGNPDPNQFTPVDGGLLFRLSDCVWGHKWWRTDGTIAGTARLDINYNPVTTQWGDVAPYQNGGKFYFSVQTLEAGWEPWVTDGSPSGTHVVKDINTGNEGSNPGTYFKVGNKYFYLANYNEIWVTDGTTVGTHIVKKMNSSVQNNGNFWGGTFYKAGDHVIFSMNDGGQGYQLWASDGTELGTVRLTNISRTGWNHFDSFTAIGSKLIFRARTSNELNLWITDGTTAGTFELMNVNDGDDIVNDIVTNGSAFAFRTYNTSVGSELFYSDGTVAGTRILDLNEGSASSSPSNLRFFGNKVAFNARLASYSTSGWDEWMYSDGTIAGTRRLDPDPNDNVYNLATTPVVLGNDIYYIATDSAHGAELWQSDGTVLGTTLVKDIRPGATGSEVNSLTVIGSKIYFGAIDGTHGQEPWVSDGTEAGTQMMVDLMPGQSTSGPGGFFGFANKIMFRANTGQGIIYYAADATTWATEPLGYEQCNAQKIELGSRLFIGVLNPTTGCEPVVTDGTTAGTFLLGDLYPGSSSSSPNFVAATSSKVYFTATDDTHGIELWVTDGTIAGTQRVSDFNVGPGSTNFMNFNVVGDGIWFQYCTCNAWVYGVSDGTAAGTHAVDTEVPSRPNNLMTVGSQVIFTSSDVVGGTEVWSWNSVTNSTNPIEVNPFTGSGPTGFTSDGTTVIFSANDNEHGNETWISDGTIAGTRLVADSNLVPQSSWPDSFFTLNGTMYFRAVDFEHGRELWKTDGTSAGTVLVKDIDPGVDSSNLTPLGQVGNNAYFTATTALYGNELWVTDGTAAGTRIVKDINTSTNSWRNSEISAFYGGPDGLFFKAFDGTTRDIWASDGTNAGTRKIDVRIGFDDEFDYGTVAGSKFYFRSRDDLDNNTGQALYAADRVSGNVTKLMTMTGVANEYPWDIRAVGSSVVFGMNNAPSPNGSWQYWMSDGTSAGTHPLDTAPNDNSYVQSIYRFGNYVAYRFDDGIHGNEWRILNGITGVSTLFDLNPYGSANISSEFVDGNTLRFRADDGVHGDEWWVSDGTVAGTRMYSDANTTGASSNPDQFTVMNGVTYFRATDPVRGTELWKTDGTSAGTVLVKDIFPGSSSSNISIHGVMGNKLFLSARSNDLGDSEPWISDGTSNGTVLLKDINTTTNWSGGSSVDYVNIGTTRTYFRAYDGTNRDFWVTDGTTAGTTKIDLTPGVDDYVDYSRVVGDKFYFRYRDNLINGTGQALYVSDGTPGNLTKLLTLSDRPNSYDYPNDLRALGNTLVFQVWNYPTVNNTWQWWMSDGTIQGTLPLDSNLADMMTVTDATFIGNSVFYYDDDGVHGREWWLLDGLTGVRSRLGLRSVDQVVVEGSRIRFRADDGVHGLEYWTSDGTLAGTQLVQDINPVGAASNATSFVKMGGNTYFIANDATHPPAIWRSDGTALGTSAISNIGLNDGWTEAEITNLVATSNQIFFTAVDPIARKELFVSDGTLAGTHMVKDIYADNNWCWWCSVQIDNVKVINNKVIFRASDSVHGREMWVSDGTENGTFMLEDSYPGSSSSEPDWFYSAGNKLFYRAQDASGNYRLHSTDGTVAGTHTINYRSDNGASSTINDFRLVGNNALLWLEDGVHGWQWWFSDGTNAGTYLLDPYPTDGNWPEFINVSGSKVFFRTFDMNNDRELYVADASGARRLGNIRLSGNSEPEQIYATSNGVIFSADHDFYGREPWITDGTVAGTHLLVDVNARASNISFDSLTSVNGKIIYRLNDNVHGWQLVASDGTAQGTSVAQINSSGTSDPSELLSLGTKAVFSAINAQSDRQLYVSDGTAVGTTALLDINASGNDNIGGLALINGLVYFAADDGTHGREMWVTDGTVGGTRMFADINPNGGSDPYSITLSNGKIYFNACESTKGCELYVVNGTNNGVISLGDLNPYGNSNANGFTAAGLKTVFNAYDNQRGYELWVTDGTASGTQILVDINPFGDSYPQSITAVNGRAVFTAIDGASSDGWHGRELWVTDGTVAGTQMIEINTSTTSNAGNSDPYNFSVLGSRVLFSAYNSSRQRELWVSDGTSAGTRMYDINTFGGGISNSPTAVGTNAVWTANDGLQADGKHGDELWVSNGTAAGTSLVDINQSSWYNSGNSYPSGFTKNGNLTYFSARNATNGNELWQTDGTPAGTTLATDVNPNTEGSGADSFVVAGNRYYFRAYTPQYGWELYTSTSATGSATLVKDIRINGDSWPDNFTVSGNKMYFRADDGINGRELWVTDGTAAGTRMVKNICRATYDCGSWIQADVNGTILFYANDLSHGYQPYVTDGTEEGTQSLDDNLDAGSNAESTVVLGNKIIFVWDDGTSGRELWSYDTTTKTRRILKDIRVGSAGSSVDSLVKFGDYVYFRANNGTDGLELWRTDGTAVGTTMVANTHPTGDGNPDYFFQVGSKIFFRSEDGVNGRTLWVTNGTAAGTLQVSTSTSAETFVAGTSKLFYRSYDSTHGWELWVSDGTPTGTHLTKDLNNSSGDTWMDYQMTSGDQLFFRANNGVSGYELATSDGTEAGTLMLGDFNPTGDSWPDYLVPMGNGKLLFRVDDGTVPSHRNLWVSDGTIAGTRALTPSYVGGNVNGTWSFSPDSIVYWPSTGKAYFRGWDAVNGAELWSTDGTVAGTQLFKNINPNGDSFASVMTVVGNQLLFRASDGLHGEEPWISDGTVSGTIALGDLNTVGASSDPSWFTKTTNRMFFSADDGNHGRELWVKDANGTRMVADKSPSGYGFPEYITALGDNVVYRYNDGVHGNELWFSDGTANGTIRLTDAVTTGDSNPDRVTSFGNKAIFRMYDPTTGWEPWITDGTLVGTFMLKDIRSNGDSDPSDFTMVGSKMFFVADDGVNGRQLWVTDGTTNGTIVLPANTSGSSNVNYLTAVGNFLYFSADDGVNGYELWKSDGTVAGTTMVKDIRTGVLSAGPQSFTVNGSSLYFTAIDDTHGRELWKSNGTAIGTTMVSDINPNGNSNPEQLVVDGSLLYFGANDGVSGREPFVSDGTAAGTGSIDINRSGGSRPERFMRNNGILYFTANDGFNGTEMWSVNGGWLASTAPNVTRSENAPLPPSGVTRPVPATLVPVLTNAPSTTQAPSVPTSAPETSSPGPSNPDSSNPEPTVPAEVPTTDTPTIGSETSAPNAIIPNTAPRVLTPPPAGSSTPSIMPVAEARQMEQERGQVSVQFNGEAVEVSQFRITGSGISSDQRDRSPGVIAEIRAQARQLVAAFDSFLPSGVASDISVVDSPTGAKIIGLMVDPNNPSVSIPIPAESVILLRTPTGAMLMGGLNNAGRPSYITSRGALAITKGGSVGLSISGMPANHNGELIIMSTPQLLGSFVVDEHGLFEGQATIPASLAFGTHTLLVSAGGMTIAVGVMVDNPVPMILPATGSSNESPVMVALFWVLLGLGLLMVRRRFKMGRN